MNYLQTLTKAKTLGHPLVYLNPNALNPLVDIRNKATHAGQEPAPAEAAYIVTQVELILRKTNRLPSPPVTPSPPHLVTPPPPPPTRPAVYRRVSIETPVNWRQWYDFYQAVIQPLVEAGIDVQVHLRLEAAGEVDANLIDLSVKESVLQFDAAGRVRVEQ